ncbi:MAG: FecR family protein, partial [Sphingobacterium sp.]|nr:FecR family protein [Sphingobacterium sp.]
MIPEEVQKLIAKYKAGNISESELSVLYSWYNQRAREPIVIDDSDMQQRLERIGRQLPNVGPKQVSFYSWYKWGAAAVAVLAIGISIYRYQTEVQPVESNLTIVADTTASAQFITADNKSISISTIALGDTVASEGLLLYKTKDGYIAYEYREGESETNLMHTVRTPIGTESKLLLPDGTKVWLNAASELTFAKQLGRANRTVFLKGEAYFEVAKQELGGHRFATFEVHSDKQVVEVLGTKFQIKSYADEAIASTSLYEGSIKLQLLDATNRTDKAVLLKPGQQGLFDRQKNVLDFKNISEGEPQTWRDGYFSFHGESLEDVCQQLARWYPVQFEISGSLPNGEYHGDIPKSYSLNEVLNILIQDKI